MTSFAKSLVLALARRHGPILVLILVLVLVGGLGCAPSALRTEAIPEASLVEERCAAWTRTQKESLLCQNRFLSARVNDLGRRLDAMQTHLDWLTCPDASVRDFLSRCALRSMDENSCDSVADADIARDLQRYSHRMVYYPFVPPRRLRPREREHERKLARDLDPERLAQLKSWAASEQLTPRSSILVLYMPYSPLDEAPSVDAANQAEHITKDLLRYFIEDILPLAHNIGETVKVNALSPRALGCQYRSETMKAYLNRPENRPVGNEPKNGQARTTVWIFHLNCPLPDLPRQPGRM